MVLKVADGIHNVKQTAAKCTGRSDSRFLRTESRGFRFMLFGSAVREDFRPDSDIDVLVEFEPGHVPGFGFFTLQDELAAIFKRDVDLNTWGFLSPHIREDVARDAVTLFDKA